MLGKALFIEILLQHLIVTYESPLLFHEDESFKEADTFTSLEVSRGSSSFVTIPVRPDKLEGISDCQEGLELDETECDERVEMSTIAASSTVVTLETEVVWQNGSCPENEFRCSNLRCISAGFVCDSDNDCGDKSDEANCTKTCDPGSVMCAPGNCIFKHWICDGESDCSDGSDEDNCTDINYYNSVSSTTVPRCEGGGFPCKNDQKCLSLDKRCNRIADCEDKSDELNCGFRSCGYNEFRCKISGHCIFSSWRCDGQNDCLDNSDEEGCSQCKADRFKCKNGMCIRNESRCDSLVDCADGSDEEDCEGGPTRLSHPLPFMDNIRNCDPQLCTACNSMERSISCPIGFEKVGDRCIEVHVFPRRWLRALQMCHYRALKGWNYWVGSPKSEEGIEETTVVHPAWFNNGRICDLQSHYPTYSDRCFFLHYEDAKIFKGTNCNDLAGFICEFIPKPQSSSVINEN